MATMNPFGLLNPEDANRKFEQHKATQERQQYVSDALSNSERKQFARQAKQAQKDYRLQQRISKRNAPEVLFKKARGSFKLEKSRDKFRIEKREYINPELKTQREREADRKFEQKLAVAKYNNQYEKYENKGFNVKNPFTKKVHRVTQGGINRGTATFFNTLGRKGGVTNYLYNRNKPKSSSGNFTSGNSYGKAGRPKGTGNPMYAPYGGVYGWRKAQAFERKKALLELKQRTNISPAQRQVLANLQARDQRQREDPERRTIPDTYGYSGQGGYHQEINDFANLVP